MTKKEMLEKRAALIDQARKIHEKANTEKRGLSAEEQQEFDRLFADADKLDTEVRRLEKIEKSEQEVRESLARLVTPPAPDPAGQLSTRQGGLIGRDSPEYREIFCRALRDIESINPIERRALQSDIPTAGGYLVPPQQWIVELIKAVDDIVFIRQRATRYSVPNANSLGAPSLDANPSDPTWTNELAIGSADSIMDFGKRELTPHPLAKSILISRKLLRQVPAVDVLVRDRLAYVQGTTQENAFLTGSGVGQPLGIFTVSALGIPATRDVSTGNTQTEIRFDGLINAKFAIKGQYWPRAAWLFPTTAVKQIATLKDGQGQYIWRPSVIEGEPERILGFPLMMSEFVPSTFTTGQYVGIVGDFSFYWIADALDMEIQTLVELYAATNQIAFVLRSECDGMPVLGEAFARVKLA